MSFTRGKAATWRYDAKVESIIPAEYILFDYQAAKEKDYSKAAFYYGDEENGLQVHLQEHLTTAN